MINTTFKSEGFSEAKTEMLYCPKCQQTYEEGAQRFCLNDGGRLLSAASTEKSVEQNKGVFSNVIRRRNAEENEEFANAPRFSQMSFRPPKSRIFKIEPESEIETASHESENETLTDIVPAPVSQTKKIIALTDEPELELELEPLAPNASRFNSEPLLELDLETEATTTLPEATAEIVEARAETETETATDSETPIIKSTARVIKRNEINAGQAALGDRKINPAGREAVSWENPQVLVGQTIKGRYRIVERIGADENAIDYLAEDKINSEKKVVARVLMDADADDSFAGAIFADERVTLSHVSHPNVAGVIDSGELSEGKPFVITEYVKGESVKERLARKGKFEAWRTARIVRQAAYALSEMHQSGILHRNLKPENIVLTVSDIGAEQVKLTNFGASKGKLNESNLPYKSPEQVEGKSAVFASDEFSLAVIAYQMLTNRLPFNSDKIGSLLKEQREGLIVKAATLTDELPASVDEILAKALSFNAADRYPKARDFGDALYNAVTTNAPTAEKIESPETAPVPTPDAPSAAKGDQSVVLKPVGEETAKTGAVSETVAEPIKAAEDLAWEKRSAELPVRNTGSRTALTLLGIAAALAGLLGIWLYFINRQNAPTVPANTPTVETPNQTANNATPPNANASAATPEDIEAFPPPRSVAQPPNTNYFQNSKDAQTGETAKNYLGFSLYYPQSWKLNEAKNNFLDVSKTGENNLPIEQLLVSYYDSRGTFKADREIFLKLLEKSNSDLKKALGDYKIISQGETKIQNGRWQAFEVKFESLGTAANGEKIKLWGRRLWIPAQLAGLKNGYVITMLATSLSKDVKNVEHVGVRGELSNILETFEPLNQ